MKNNTRNKHSLFIVFLCLFFTSFQSVAQVADLKVSSPESSSMQPIAGTQTVAGFVVINAGTVASGYSYLGYYLSADAVLSAEDVFLSSLSIDPLNAGAAKYRNAYVTIPLSTLPGNYYLLYKADNNGTITESDETNNTAALAIIVREAYVDLTVSTLSVTKSSLPVGLYTTATVTVRNIGTTTTEFSVVKYYLSADNIFDGTDALMASSAAGTLFGAGVTKNTTIYVPSNATPGPYFLLAVADALNQVTEKIETNNMVSIPFTVVANTVDFAMQAPTVSLQALPGVGAAVSSTVSNSGNTGASAERIGYYLSADALFDSGDTYLGYTYCPTVAAVYSLPITGSPLIPASTVPGNYYMIYYADDLNAVAETNETNNNTSQPITIKLPFTDVGITAPTAPATAIVSTSISLSCKLTNIGTLSITPSNLAYYLSVDNVYDVTDVLLDTYNGTAMTPNQVSVRTKAVRIPDNTPAGPYYIVYYADYTNVLAETDETNNFLSLPITLTSRQVDLKITGPATTTAMAAPNYTFSVTGVINNIGGNADVTSSIGFYLSTDTIYDAADVLMGSTGAAVVAINTPSTRTGLVTIPAGKPKGTYYIIMHADFLKTIDETNELNNYAWKSIKIDQFYLMTNGTSQVTTCSGYLFDSGGPTYAYGNNENSVLTIYPGVVGNKVKLEFNKFYYFTDLEPLKIYDGTSTSAPLRSNTGTYQNPGIIYGTSASGALTIEFKSDEDFIGNGFGAFISCVSVLPTIDLLFESTSAPATNVAGANMNLGYQVRNNGIFDASSASVHFLLSKDTLYDVNDQDLGFMGVIGNLKAGLSYTASGNLNVEPTTPSGNYYLIYYVDRYQHETESTETNNIVWRPIIILGPGMDLTPSLPAAPAVSQAGTSISVSSTVTNAGVVATPASKIGYYLSSNKTLEAADVFLGSSNLNAFSSAQAVPVSSVLSIPFSTLQGSYYILYVTDYDQQISETQETNNLAYAAITVNGNFTATITSPSTSFCENGSVLLTANTGSFYKWFNSTTEVGTTQTYQATAAGSYTVEVTDATGYKATSTALVITVNTLPTVVVTSASTSFCSGKNLLLTASNASSYKWFKGTTQVGTAETYTAVDAGSYTVAVTDAAGCKDTSDAAVITVNKLPIVEITSSSTSFCAGESLLLTASAGASYKWMLGINQVGTSQTYSAAISATYSLDVIDIAGCKNTAIITVNEITPTAWFADLDGDGAGDVTTPQLACTKPANYVSVPGDDCPDDVNKIDPGNCGCGNTELSCIDCAGVPNGTAALDVCNVCSGGITGIIPKVNLNECTATAVTNGSGIEYISIYPNPFESKITIDTKGEFLLLYIYDISGLLIDTIQTNGKNEIGEQWVDGIYLIRYVVGDRWYQFKIIKN